MRIITAQSRHRRQAVLSADLRDRRIQPLDLRWRVVPQFLAAGVEARRAEPGGPSRNEVAAIATTIPGAGSIRPEPAMPFDIKDVSPGLLDRLTDDVIRRVEQRVRIDRERRGL
ncbi:hypothetical protein [Paraburkholderia terrae]|nr:hypothetical protein [Paraburkholderia terrae]